MKPYSIITLAAAAAATAACTPRLYQPQIDAPAHYVFADGFRQDSITIGYRWWEMFDDAALDSLITYALDNNRDLFTAASRVSEARAALASARAEFLPSADISIGAKADYDDAGGIRQQYAITPSVAWEIPLFGSLRHTTRAAKAQILAAEWNYYGVMLSLSAEVATSYFMLQQYNRDLEIARRSYVLRSETAALVDSMYRYGFANGVARRQAQSLVYEAESDIPLYERQVEQTQLALCTLLGVAPERFSPQTVSHRLTADYTPLDIPIGLPSDLLYRRPDVMASYYAMRQAEARVGIARSARLPSISLTADGGTMSSAAQDLFSGKSWIWSAAASLVQPIFAFGKLKRQEQAARDRYYQSLFAYEQSVIDALADVEKCLAAISTYRAEAANYARLLEANTEIADMTSALYINGMTAYLDVIDAQRNMYSSQMEYVNLIAQQYINYVNLVKALGGGW